MVQRLSDISWMLQGMCKINQAQIRIACDKYNHLINNCSVLHPILEKYCKQNTQSDFPEHDAAFQDVDFEMPDENIDSNKTDSPGLDHENNTSTPTSSGTVNPKREYSTCASHSTYSSFLRPKVNYSHLTDTQFRQIHSTSLAAAIAAEELAKIAELSKNRKIEKNILNLKTKERNVEHSKQKLSNRSQERRVPSSRIGRVASFGGLAAGLLMGSVSDIAKKTLGMETKGTMNDPGLVSGSALLSEANLERIVSTLCRVRGAALKLGQMLSIQDETIIDPRLLEVFERVRNSADFMPVSQMKKVLVQEFGADWNEKLAHFEDKPFAAASIGQVHRGVLHDGREVAIKIQYPGVANSINSDISNLVMVLKMWNIFPENFFIDKFIAVAKKELALECDYVREAEYSKKFKEMLKDDDRYHIPEVIPELSTKQVLTTELITGIPLDQVSGLDQETRNFVASAMLNLVLREIFEFHTMQTDPNWSNFFYNDNEKKMHLLDFGASREYRNSFVDDYIEVVRAASLGDRETVLEKSRKLKFLTGYETKVMEEAHVDAVMILGEPFASDEPFDYGTQKTTRRIARLVPTMLEHRLAPPPEETYSLHRKLSGGFLLAAKLNGKFACKQVFDSLYDAHHARKSGVKM